MIQEHGVTQFLNLFKKEKHRTDPFKWGDETEYTIVKFDDKKKKVSYQSLGVPLVFQLSSFEHFPLESHPV